jgi:O-antigen/teichoic acid export membrane protein
MSIRKALAYAFTTRYFALAIQFAATIILARLLTPAEIGIYSVGAAIIMIAQTLRDFGTSTYIIQERELSRERLATAFTVTVIVAWSIAAGLWVIAEPAARFYAEPGVHDVLQVMALNFLLLPFGSISAAMLRRDMNFQAIMYIGIASTLAHSGSSVLFAWLGWGFISLAWGAVCGSVVSVLGAMIANPRNFIFKPTLRERQRVLSFSLRSSVSSIAAEAGHAAPDVVLGKTLGMEATGLFSRAMGYVQLFERLLQDVLRSVMLPYLAEAERSGADVSKRIRIALENIVSVSLLMVALTGILAEPLVLLLFGEQWREAILLAQILCIAMAIRCTGPTLSAALVAGGHIRLIMHASLTTACLKFILLAAFSIHGLLAAAIGFVVAEILNIMILIFICNRSGYFSWRSFLSIFSKSTLITGISVGPALMLSTMPLNTNSFMELTSRVMVAGTLSLTVWIAVIWITKYPPYPEISRIIGNVLSRFKKN